MFSNLDTFIFLMQMLSIHIFNSGVFRRQLGTKTKVETIRKKEEVLVTGIFTFYNIFFSPKASFSVVKTRDYVARDRINKLHQVLYSPTILWTVLCLLQIFLYLEAFDCNTISNWLNHTV